ncbi:MAG TPA: glycine cleavage T C-terminal barrel domain-containing protein [Terriglobales bacterium]|nr:glycine cleavage T C-terminal barrel domain-containing protein [Terriglobales bacterium]
MNQDAATNEIGDGYADLTALTTGCGLYRAERALFSITGRDRVRWLNGMVSNNIRDLAAGHGVYAFVLNPQAHILGDLYVFNRGEGLIAEIEREQAQSLMQILRRYIIMDKVEIEDHSDKLAILGVIGPKSAEALANIGLNADLKSLECRDANWNNSPVTLVRNDNPYFPSFELWVPRDVQDSLRDALARAECEEVSQETLEIFRIFCGFPKFGQDIREKILPQETGQERALNFAKGCYIGQEIVERIRARGSVHRTFIGFEMEGIVPAGTKIQNDGKDVGEITSAINKQLRGKWLALGYLRKEFLDRQLTAAGTAVKPVTLPLTKIFS